MQDQFNHPSYKPLLIVEEEEFSALILTSISGLLLLASFTVEIGEVDLKYTPNAHTTHPMLFVAPVCRTKMEDEVRGSI